jgi:chromosome segregation ATPase
MQISAQWLIIVCLLAVIPAMIGIIYTITIRYALTGAMSLLKHDVNATNERITNLTAQWTELSGDLSGLERKLSEAVVAVHGCELKIVNSDESIRALSNKWNARAQSERRAAKREESESAAESDDDQIPVEQLELFQRMQQQQNQYPPVGAQSATGQRRIIHPS